MSVQRIDRTDPPGPVMSRAVVHGEVVHLCFTPLDASGDVRAQTRDALGRIDHYLARAGTSRSKLLHAQIWIKDMADFGAMNEVWNEWVDHEAAPVRACVQADMGRPDVLVEIKVIAHR